MISLVIMAAGLGTRFGGFKQVEGVGPHSELLLEYALYDALKCGLEEAILVVNEEILPWISSHLKSVEERISIKYLIQEKDPVLNKPLGTGHAALLAMKHASGPVIIINADDYYGRNPIKMVSGYLGGDTNSAMAVYLIENTLSNKGPVSRAVIEQDKNGYLIRASEYKRIQEVNEGIVGTEQSTGNTKRLDDQLVSLNLWGLQKEIAPFIEQEFSQHNPSKGEFFLPDVITKSITAREIMVKVFRTENEWFGLTYREDLDHARKVIASLIEKGHYPATLWT